MLRVSRRHDTCTHALRGDRRVSGDGEIREMLAAFVSRLSEWSLLGGFLLAMVWERTDGWTDVDVGLYCWGVVEAENLEG